MKTLNQIHREFWRKHQRRIDKAISDPDVVRKANQAVIRSTVIARLRGGEPVSFEQALLDEYLKDFEERFSAGRKRGTGSPIRKAIADELKRDPRLSTADLWSKISLAPPRGWTLYDNRIGKYAEGPKAGQNMSYARFSNVASEERKLTIK
jgi:hypothetical protein